MAGKGYDLFLSYAEADQPWVRTLARELEGLGLEVFLDEIEIKVGDNRVLRLSEGLEASRFLVLVLSPSSIAHEWVTQGWTSYISLHGPLGRVLPVMIEPVGVPPFLKATVPLTALHRDARRLAPELAAIIGRPGDLHSDDDRRLVLGQQLTFVLERSGEGLRVTGPDGKTREVTPPWRSESAAAAFTGARLGFRELSQKPIVSPADHAEIGRHARTLGELLFAVLFDDISLERLGQAALPGYPRPVVTLLSDDDVLLSLPWELLFHESSFLVRDGQIDLFRSALDEVGPGALVPEPDELFKLVVNVSAPEGSGLDYEGESYRITRTLSESCELTPTELGTVEDLLETAEHVRPTGIHFSGHGSPGRLQFEDDEGREHVLPVAELAADLKRRVPGGLPPFFYLASCHGNEPAVPEEGRSGVSTAPGWRRWWATTARSTTSSRPDRGGWLDRGDLKRQHIRCGDEAQAS